MVKVALLVKIEARPGKEADVAALLESALPLANPVASTTVWFAVRFGPTSFGVFDAFANDAGRDTHLAGPIAKALMGAGELLARPFAIEKLDVLAAKVPG
jgi:quinol monooxygenase YgiN